MTTEKRYEILESLPPYGPMYVPVTADGKPYYSEGVPVRFYKADGTDWVANFQPGWTELKQIIELKNTSNLLVVAGGTCYLMNPNDPLPIKVFGVCFSEIFKATNDRLVFQDQVDLTIVEADGGHWTTERISWDGLKNLQVQNNIVTGLSFDPTMDADEWIPFTYNLDTKTLTGSSFQRHFKKKPWWKI